MPSMPARTRRTAGFTLVEILVIAPIILIMVSGFIALMVSMVGDVMQTRDHNALTYDTQYALDRIEQDTHLSTRFLSTTGTQTAPQGSNSNFTGTAAFTAGTNTLIFNQPSTDADPTSPSRRLIYYAMQPNPCGPTESFNRIFTHKVVYFVKDNTLWRRSLVPDWNTNSTPDANTICDDYSVTGRPWARNSCSPGQTATRCETNDEEIMKNIASLTTKYYSTPGGSSDLGAENAEDAAAIEVTIAGSKTTAGNSYSTNSTLRASKINSLDTDIRAIETPVVSHTFPTPDKVTFSWSPVLGAVTYNTWYNINGGAWQYLSVGSGTTSRTIDAASRGDTVSFVVSAVTTTGTSENGLDAATLDLWTDIPLTNGWSSYGGGFTTPQFTKSSNGTVFLKGIVTGGSTGANDVIGTLPEGYRPSNRLVYAVGAGGYTNGRLDVDSDGSIRFYSGNNNYMSLDGINFLPGSSPYSWTEYNFANGWSNWGGQYETVHSAKDSLGRVHVQGLARSGTTTHNTVVAQPPNSSGLVPNDAIHFPSGASNWSNFWVWNGAAQLTKRGSSSSSYMSLQALYYPGSAGGSTIGWTNLPLSGGWSYYGSNFPYPQYTKASDKVCTVRGVVTGGSTNIHTTIGTLPPACRPTERMVLTVVGSSDIYGRVDLETDGKISFEKGSSGWMTLNFSFITN